MIYLMNAKFEEIEPNMIKTPKLSFLDPPDNQNMQYENYKDNLLTKEYIKLLEVWTVKACSITDGPVFISISEKWVSDMEHIIRKNSIPLHKRIYWHYNFGQANKYTYSPCIRNIYWLNKLIIYPENIKIPSDRMVKYKDKRAASDGKMPSNLWDFSRVCGTFKERRPWHPTQHPEALIERIVLGHSKNNDIVLDPFIGSGTTAIVCKKLNRNCIGIDCSEFYLKKINELINQNEN